MTGTSKAECLVHLAAPDLAITHGWATADEMEDTAREYQAFLSELDKEWPPERIKEYLLERKRMQYKSAAIYIQKLELDNRDARVRGVSYKVRKAKYVDKIAMGRRVLGTYKRQGEQIKRETFGCASLYMEPIYMLEVQERGLENRLDTVFFDYPQVPA